MKLSSWILVSLLALSMAAVAQDTGAQGTTGSDQDQNSTATTPRRGRRMQGGDQGRMQEMQQAMQQARQNIDAMRADADKTSDPNMKDYMQKNTDMWEHMLNHMQQMMERGQNMRGRRGQGGMGGNNPPSQTPPPQQ
jgi:TolA-binding protein